LILTTEKYHRNSEHRQSCAAHIKTIFKHKIYAFMHWLSQTQDPYHMG